MQSAAGADVGVVILHGAVLIARKGNKLEERLKKLADAGAKIYIRKEDLDARAINGKSITSFGKTVDTVEIVNLAAKSDTLVSVI
jgi:sulfur relay protein TusB/DsrH